MFFNLVLVQVVMGFYLAWIKSNGFAIVLYGVVRPAEVHQSDRHILVDFRSV